MVPRTPVLERLTYDRDDGAGIGNNPHVNHVLPSVDPSDAYGAFPSHDVQVNRRQMSKSFLKSNVLKIYFPVPARRSCTPFVPPTPRICSLPRPICISQRDAKHVHTTGHLAQARWPFSNSSFFGSRSCIRASL